MRLLSLSLLLATLLFSCQDDSIEQDEYFTISIAPNIHAIDLVEEGRASTNGTTYTEVLYAIYDTSCENVVSEAFMINSETIPSLVFPDLAAAKYYYNIEVRGSENIDYDSAGSFVLESDTIIEAVLTNKQFRYKFEDVSDFNEAEVDYVRCQLNFSTIYVSNMNTCTDTFTWTEENYDGYVDEISYYPYATDFRYSNPIDMVSFQVKYYDENSILLKSHIIPMSQKLEKHHSYTFKVDLSTIWTDESNGNRINVSIEDVTWTEEVIQVN